jgi:hypothetical protein
VVTKKAVHILQPDGSRKLVPHPEPRPIAIVMFRVSGTANADFYLRYASLDSAGASVGQIMRFAHDGTREEVYPPQVSPLRAMPVRRASQDFALAFGPPWLGLASAGTPSEVRAVRPPVRHKSWFVPLLLALLTVSVVAVVALSRRHSLSPSRTLLWVAITIALGPLGLVLMLAIVEWPVLEPCPACGRQRVVTRDSCEHCAAGVTKPAKDGTEIMEPAGLAV